MNSPRIYLYKVTFEEVPHWYWGIHKEKKFGETYLGSPKTHRWMWDFYTPQVEILQLFPHTADGWEEAKGVEDRVIRPDLNNSLCLNEARGGLMSLESCSRGGRKGMEVNHSQRDPSGKSIFALKGTSMAHREKDGEGRSVNAMKGAQAAHIVKDEKGRSVNALKGGRKAAEKLHAMRDEKGRSLHGVSTAERTNSQVWESKMDGFRGGPGPVANHNKANGWDPNARFRVK
jgi:hypothetical protein